ncbi:MAG: carbohydrate-binding domain-containing protein [Oscillospiraceae bacterium]|nr:carbohydrate-binding domain-containing protein [Oscillospiraceae bacterium]
MKREILCALLTSTVMMSTASCSFAKSGNVASGSSGTTIIYDGQEIEFDTEPINMNGTVLVPMRAVFEALGTNVKWDAETQTVYARKKAKTYRMTIGSDEISETKNDETVQTITANEVIQLIDGRTMIPLRAVGEIFGLDVNWNGDTETVTLNTPQEEDSSWQDNMGTINVTTSNVTGSGVIAEGKIITVTEGGVFSITGISENHQIIVDTDERVELELSGCEITSRDGAAIYVKNADKCIITAKSGTTNTLSDGGDYSEESETNAVIYAKDDLKIKGKGVLNINGNTHNGITVKDSFEISNGKVNITSTADGIHVNDTCEISGGTVNVTSGNDGIQSESILNISGGTVNVTCTGEVTGSNNMEGFGMWRGGMMQETGDDESEDESSKGLKAGWMMSISGGDITVNSNDTCVKCDSELDISGGKLTLTSEKKKGIKGMEDVNISGGTIDIKKSTEGIETKRVMTIDGGDISVIASDDGFNAGGGGFGNPGFGGGIAPPEMKENADGMHMGSPEIERRPDRMQMQPEMPGNGGRGGMRPGGRGGQKPGAVDQPREREQRMPGGMGRFGAESDIVSTEHHIEINDGTIYINASGDGIDSNGSIIINGGIITVDGPTSGGDSAIDHDGLFQINGGTVIAAGSSGMIENPSDSSAQNVISAYVSAVGGSEITIRDSSGTEICSRIAKKNAGHIIYSSDKIKTGETYTVCVDGTEQGSGTIKSSLTIIGSQTERSNMGGRGSFGSVMGM